MPKKKNTITEAEAFLDFFKEGVAFWTSEDGMPTDLLIVRNHDDQFEAKVALFRTFSHIKGLDWSRRLSRAFVKWGRIDREWFDGGGPKPRRPEAWQLSDEPTEYPVWHLQIFP